MSKMKKSQSASNIYDQIREVILKARHEAYRHIDALKVISNFMIGKIIVMHEQAGAERAAYGKETLKSVSKRLSREFGRGFSVDNMERMRNFYLLYKPRLAFIEKGFFLAQPISATVSRKSHPGKSATASRIFKITDDIRNPDTLPRTSAEDLNLLRLSWSHFVLLMKMDELERGFYEIESIANNWGIRELERQYNASLYERLALSKDKQKVKELSRRGQLIENPSDLIKQPYILEFLGLKEESAYSETDLERAIIDRIENFLLELGKGFLFEARQKRISFQGENFYIDLVFYNRLLRCYVLIDLKIGKISHENIGQMQMYVNYFDRMVKQKNENSTVGIILCKQSNKAVVEFTLPEKERQIFAREYRLYLPAKEELKRQIEKM